MEYQSNLFGPKHHETWLSLVPIQGGLTTIRWAMPDGKVRRTVQVTGQPTLVQRTWNLLDQEVDAIYAALDDTSREYHKARASGIADVLAMFMVPFFETSADISKEAGRRRKARLSGDVEYETAGLGTRRYEPPPGTDKYRLSEPISEEKKQTRFTRGVRKAEKQLTEAEVNSIKAALAAGMFTPEQLAGTFKVSVEKIKSFQS